MGEMKEKQFETVPNIERILQSALYRAYATHEALGSRGEELVQKNQFGETTLRIDIEAEEAVLDFLKESGIPIRVISEEHGKVEIVPSPVYLGILDGLDGSNRYQAGRGKERYGTMLGIFSDINPVYGDYVTSGIMEHSTGKLFVAGKGVGSFLLDAQGGKIPLHASEQNILSERTRIYVNEHFDVRHRVFSEKLRQFRTTDPCSYATYFSDLASGEVDLVLTYTAKNNLEPAIGYGFVAEAGGVMVDLNGESLQDKKYFEFGQYEELPIIIASTEALARDLIRHIRDSR